MRRMHKRGFTLVELLASIAIIALSMALCLPNTGVSSASGPTPDDGPLTVRFFNFTVPHGVTVSEQELRRRLDGSPFEFCGVEVREDGHGSMAVWVSVASQYDDNVEGLGETLGTRWEIRDYQAPEPAPSVLAGRTGD